MLYLSGFEFPDAEREVSFIMGEKRTCYDSFYPFRVLSRHGLTCHHSLRRQRFGQDHSHQCHC